MIMHRISKNLIWFIVLGLLLFWHIDGFCAQTPSKNDLENVLPEADVFARKLEPFPHYLAYISDGGYFAGVAFMTTEVVPEESNGYRDKIFTLVGVNDKGEITGIKVLEENETPSYTKSLLEDGSWFLEQFISKTTDDDFLLGSDIDAITGATISSSSIAHAVETGLEVVSKEVLYREIKEDSPSSHVALNHLLWQADFVFIWIILGLAIFAYRKGRKALRYLVMGLVIVYIGYVKGGGFSIIDVVNIFSLNLSVFSNNLYWYSLVVIAVGSTIIAGRFYCGWFCPFGAVLELIWRLTPGNVLVPRAVDRCLRLIKYFNLIVILVVLFVFANRDVAVYIASVVEPFGLFFRLYGVLIAWFFFLSMFVASIFISRFYCRYICPLGAFFALLSMASSFFKIKQVSIELPLESCKGCALAGRECPMGAISLGGENKQPEIDNNECIRCGLCKSVCPVFRTEDRKRIKSRG